MKHRIFGRSGIKVSEIIFGAGAVGGILIHKDDATKREAIRRALAGGINWVDTAAAYGNGKSEEALGWLLPEAGATPYLSTKFGLDVENLKDIPARIEESLVASLARLKRKSVDLLQLHNRIGTKPGGRVMTVEQILGKNGVADGLDRLREKGLIRHRGITAIGEAASVCEVIRSGRFDSAQVYYNLLNPSAGWSMPQGWTGQNLGGIIEACRANQVAVMAIRIFAAGVIATDERTGRESVLIADTSVAEDERKTRAVFDAIGTDQGTRAQVALRFVLSNPDVSCAVIGSAELHHIDEALQGAAMGPLPPHVLARLDGLYDSDFGRVLVFHEWMRRKEADMQAARVGDFEVHCMTEFEGPFIAPEVFFPDYDREVLRANPDMTGPRLIDAATGKLVFSFHSFVVKTGHHTILIDSCIGNDKERPTRPQFHRLQSPFLADLAHAGVKPEDVDYVMCTHLHWDHVGWNTRLENGRWVPTFPNARYIMARREFEHWQGVQQRAEETPHRLAFEDSVLPVVRTGQSLLVDDDYALEDGLWFESAPGHTPGNVVIHARSRDDSAVFLGDVLHHQFQLMQPEWSTLACTDREQSRKTRMRLVEEYAERGTRLLPGHFPAPTAGRIIRHGGAYRYAFE